ncbi:MAG: CaiB/BaiF CoA transferase family protein [Brevundimonas sp.]
MSATRPLNGVRILEFDGLGPVTLAGMMLADMGAEVLRLTRPTGGAFEEVGGAILHRGRSAVVVDLKSPDDLEAVRALIGRADALIEGYRPGVMERLGLSPEACRQLNPALVYGRVTGWGQTGPLAASVGHDLNYLSLTGALAAMGPPDRPPTPPLNLVADYGGGAMLLVSGVLAALLEARRTGLGRVVDAAMVDGVATMSSLFHALLAKGLWRPERGCNLLDGGAPFYRCYACADGRYVAVGALEPQFFAALVQGLGLGDAALIQYDPSGWSAMHALFEARFATASRDEWTARFAGTDACVTPVLSFEEARSHPHAAARDAYGPDGAPRPAPRFDGGPALPVEASSRSLAETLAAWAETPEGGWV